MKKNVSNVLPMVILAVALIFWKCPFETLTGLPCPGCMMTSALYHLLRLDFKTAFYLNPVIYFLLMMSFPLMYSYKKDKRRFKYLLTFTVAVWIGIYAYRMLTVFPNYPMMYVKDNLFSRLSALLDRLFK